MTYTTKEFGKNRFYLTIDRITKVLLGHPDEAGPYENGHSDPVVQLEHHIVDSQIISFQDGLS